MQKRSRNERIPVRRVTIVMTCLSFSLSLHAQDESRDYIALSISCIFVNVKALAIREIDSIANPANSQVFSVFLDLSRFFSPFLHPIAEPIKFSFTSKAYRVSFYSRHICR